MIDRFHLTFVAVARHMSYTKAAEELCLTQPAVSQHIKYLEELYTTELVSRDGRLTRITGEGEVLYSYILKAVKLKEQAAKEIRNMKNRPRQYDLGATLTIGEYVLPGLLGSYRTEYPYDEIILHVANTDAIAGMLFEGTIDLGFVEGRFKEKLFDSLLLCRDELILAASPVSSVAGKRYIDIEDLSALRLILREPGSGTRQAFEDALMGCGLDIKSFNPYMSIGSLTTIKNMVERNLGCTVISRLAVENELKKRNPNISTYKKSANPQGFQVHLQKRFE